MNITGLGIYEGEGCLPKALWRDSKFVGLPLTDKLLYVYLCTGIEFEQSGIFLVDSDSLCAATGLSQKELDRGRRHLMRMGFTMWSGNVVWIFGVREEYVRAASPRAIQQMNRQVRLIEPGSPVLHSYLEHFDLDAGETTATSDIHTAVALVTGQDILLFGERERNLPTSWQPSGLLRVPGTGMTGEGAKGNCQR